LNDSLRSQFSLFDRARKALSDPSRALKDARATAEATTAMARTVLEGVTPLPFNGPLSDKRAVAWQRLSLNEVKALKNRFGGTVNDVVLTVIAGGLMSYLQGRGVKTLGKELKAMVPVNVRADKDKASLGNHVSGLIATLPLGIGDPISRLRHVSAAMELLKMSGQAHQLERLVDLADLLPPALQRPLAALQGAVAPVHTVCTNVPGPRERRYLLGRPVEIMVPLVPLGASIGLGFAILSYADQLTIGINADAQRERDPSRVAHAIGNAFEELWAASGLERVSHAKVDSALKRRERQETPKPAAKPAAATNT
jgi:WS/DGAT/MGAT family acyltransferase